MRNSVVFYLNGQRHEVLGDLAFLTVAEYLRYQRGLTGTKVVCAEGDCGACSILRARPYLNNKDIGFEAVNSCIMMVAQLDASSIVTIEGLSENDSLSCSQKAMIDCHASQCGFCTPGFVVTLEWMLERHKTVDEKIVQNHLTGNLCRCTGYKPIVEAGLLATSLRNEKPLPTLQERYLTSPIIKELRKLAKQPVQIEGTLKTFFAPTDLKSLKAYRKKYPTSIILGAGTDLGVQINKGKKSWTDILSLQLLTETYKLDLKQGTLKVGAQVTLSQLRKNFLKHPQLANILDLFASPQIKNAATLVGNVANASPIADTPPFLLALDTTIEILNPSSTKTKIIPLSEFYLEYRKTQLQPGDVIIALYMNWPKANQHLMFYKNSQRKDLDISCLNMALMLELDKNQIVKSSRLALGGVAATPLRLYRVENELIGHKIHEIPWEKVNSTLQNEINPLSDLRGTSSYRRILAQNILRKLIHETSTP